MEDQEIEELFPSLFAKKGEKRLSKALYMKAMDVSNEPDLFQANQKLDSVRRMLPETPEARPLLEAYAQKKIALEELWSKGVRGVLPASDGSGTYMVVTPALAAKLIKNGRTSIVKGGMPPDYELKAALEAGTISEDDIENLYKFYYNPDGSPSFEGEATDLRPTDYSKEAVEAYRRSKARKERTRGNN